MKSFSNFVADRPIYVRKEGELTYDLSEDVFIPGIGIKETKSDYQARLKKIREAALPKNWKGMVS